ncbi:hypothetical protein HYN59_00590 [Flavobacterium album]|uniref:Cytochrome C551 n=1 Tax=Flavobacterium album TaxID=2175091 RepID=A0A2S1QTH5_9FLAO|nr:hypothetical protein [Flavobacterium album]AWH83702.1 hypothetical protein HYN59_00590 [Flavobacterium album]
MKKVIVLSAVLFAATLSLTSCGKKEESKEVETETVAEPQTETEAATETPDSVKVETTTTVEKDTMKK